MNLSLTPKETLIAALLSVLAVLLFFAFAYVLYVNGVFEPPAPLHVFQQTPVLTVPTLMPTVTP